MEFPIVDCHSHWGPSITLDSNVSTRSLLQQMKEAGVTRAVVAPFPSTAAESGEINVRLLNESRRVEQFIPYYHLREDLSPVPGKYYGGVAPDERQPGCGLELQCARRPRAVQPHRPPDGDRQAHSLRGGSPVHEAVCRDGHGLPLIIPHLGMTGGNPVISLKTFKDKPKVCSSTPLAGKETIIREVS